MHNKKSSKSEKKKMTQEKKKQEEKKETLEKECEKKEQSIEYPEPLVSMRPIGAIATSPAHIHAKKQSKPLS